jgi:hypothetical protein
MPAVGTGPRPSARPPQWAPAIACVPCGRCATHVSQAKGGSRSDKEPVRKRLFFRSHGALSRRGPIRNKLQQRPVGIAKINAHTLTFGPEARDRSELHWHIAASQMRDRRVDRPMPFEAQITVTGLNWQPGHRHGTKTRAVHIELRPTKPVRPPRELFDEISAHDLLVECVAACPVGHVNHAVVERYAKHLTLPLRLRSRNVKRLIRPFRHRVRALAKAAHPVATRTTSPFRPVSRVDPRHEPRSDRRKSCPVFASVPIESMGSHPTMGSWSRHNRSACFIARGSRAARPTLVVGNLLAGGLV